MVRYKGTIQGCGNFVARLGTAESGIRVAACGQNVGVRVCGNPSDKDGEDVFTIHVTGKCTDRLIALVRADEKGVWWNVNLPHMSDLLAACRALRPLLDADLEALTPWKKEIEALTKLL